MKARQHIGNCKLCGKYKELTKEHVPPQKAFNSTNVIKYSFEDSIKMMAGDDGRMPWDNSGIKGKTIQGGNSDYYLCRECNNNTGNWYMREYVDFTHTLSNMIISEGLQSGEAITFTLLKIRPLRIYKAIMTMFCDINHECFGDKNLRKFLLEKESNNIGSKRYSIYAFLVTPNSVRYSGFSVLGFLNGSKGICLSEVIRYPIGFTLYIDPPEDCHPYEKVGISIDEFAKCNYDDIINVRFMNMPYLDICSQMPAEFRSKEEIQQQIEMYKYEE